MAVTKLLYMKDCGKGFPGKHLKAALDYISVVDKTQGGRLIAGVNCRPGYAYEQMRDTKQKFGKTETMNVYEYTCKKIIKKQEKTVHFQWITDIELTRRNLEDKSAAISRFSGKPLPSIVYLPHVRPKILYHHIERLSQLPCPAPFQIHS